MSHDDFEPVPGLPAPLPPAERILWQGAPRWQSLARRAFHVGHVALYFAVLLVWDVAAAVRGGMPLPAALAAAAVPAILSLGALGVLALLGHLSATATLYTITDRRVVIRSGIALSFSINLPYSVIDGASLRLHADGTGDIPVELAAGQRIGFLVNWPNVRPWRITRPQPMLRAVPDAARVGALLAEALAAVTAPAAARAVRAPEPAIDVETARNAAAA